MEWTAAFVGFLGLLGVAAGAALTNRGTERHWLYEQRINAYVEVLLAVRGLQAALVAMAVRDVALRIGLDRPEAQGNLIEQATAATEAAFRALFVAGRLTSRLLADVPAMTAKALEFAVLPGEEAESMAFALRGELNTFAVDLLKDARKELPSDRAWAWAWPRPWRPQPEVNLWRYAEGSIRCVVCEQDVPSSILEAHHREHVTHD